MGCGGTNTISDLCCSTAGAICSCTNGTHLCFTSGDICRSSGAICCSSGAICSCTTSAICSCTTSDLCGGTTSDLCSRAHLCSGTSHVRCGTNAISGDASTNGTAGPTTICAVCCCPCLCGCSHISTPAISRSRINVGNTNRTL